MGLPYITVVTVCFNAADFIEDTIRSVIGQTYENLEYIIIDGGSSDGTVNIVSRYLDRIAYFESSPDNGIYDAMNKAIRKAKGQWINFLNAGDCYLNEDTVYTLFCSREEPGGCFLKYGDSVIFNKEFEVSLKAKQFSLLNLLLWGTRTVCHQAIFAKTSEIAFYDTRYRLKGELNWYFDLIKGHKKEGIQYYNVDIVRYRLGGLSAQQVNLDTKEQFLVLYRRLGLFGVLLGAPVLFYRYFRTQK